MAALGIRAVLAVSLNGLFFRNCINHGFAAGECSTILDVVTEPDEVSFDLATGEITNLRADVGRGRACHPELIAILNDGGILPRLIREGYVELKLPQLPPPVTSPHPMTGPRRVLRAALRADELLVLPGA